MFRSDFHFFEFFAENFSFFENPTSENPKISVTIGFPIVILGRKSSKSVTSDFSESRTTPDPTVVNSSTISALPIERSNSTTLSPRRGIFKEQPTYTEYRFRVYEGKIHDAPRGNGWACVAPARAPGFGIPRRVPRVDGIPWRNFGGRTAALVRSVLRRASKMPFSRRHASSMHFVVTVARGWGHGTVAISAPRSLGTRAYRFPGYPGQFGFRVLDRLPRRVSSPPAGPPAVCGWI